LWRLTISARIYSGFYILVGLTLALAVFALLQWSRVAADTQSVARTSANLQGVLDISRRIEAVQLKRATGSKARRRP